MWFELWRWTTTKGARFQSRIRRPSLIKRRLEILGNRCGAYRSVARRLCVFGSILPKGTGCGVSLSTYLAVFALQSAFSVPVAAQTGVVCPNPPSMSELPVVWQYVASDIMSPDMPIDCNMHVQFKDLTLTTTEIMTTTVTDPSTNRFGTLVNYGVTKTGDVTIDASHVAISMTLQFIPPATTTRFPNSVFSGIQGRNSGTGLVDIKVRDLQNRYDGPPVAREFESREAA